MALPQPLRETELALLNAPFEPEGWTRALELFAHATASAGANLVAVGGPVAPSLNLLTGRDGALANLYFSRRELWGPCNWRVNSTGRLMTVQHDADYAAYRQSVDTSDYDDAVSDLDMQYGCQSLLISDSRTFVGLAAFRGRREGPCDAGSLASFKALLRPMQRAIRLQIALSGEAAEMMLGDPGALHGSVVLLDRHGCVCAMSPAAELLAEGDGPIRLAGLLFELADRNENRIMQQALARLLSNEGWGDSDWVHEMRVGGTACASQAAWTARAFRLPQREHGLGFHPHAAIIFEQCPAA